MKTFCGVLMIVAGIALGLYVGVWVCLVGGVVDVVNNFNHGTVGGVLWGIIKFSIAGVAGYLSAFLLVFPGAALVSAE